MGCGDRYKKGDVEEHLRGCEFRIVECDACGEYMCWNLLGGHICMEECRRCGMRGEGDMRDVDMNMRDVDMNMKDVDMRDVDMDRNCIRHISQKAKETMEDQRAILLFIEGNLQLTKYLGEQPGGNIIRCIKCSQIHNNNNSPHLPPQIPLYICTRCQRGGLCLTCLNICNICHRMFCDNCLISSKLNLPKPQIRACVDCMGNFSSHLPLDLLPISATTQLLPGYELNNILTTSQYWCSINHSGINVDTNKIKETILLKLKSGPQLISRIIINPNTSYPFTRLQVSVGTNYNNFKYHSLVYTCQNTIQINYNQFVLGNFIRIVMKGVNNSYIAICSVTVYGPTL